MAIKENLKAHLFYESTRQGVPKLAQVVCKNTWLQAFVGTRLDCDLNKESVVITCSSTTNNQHQM